MLHTLFTCGQKIALALGLPLLLFLGLRAEHDTKAAFTRDALLAFALLSVILLVITGGLWAELHIRWPLPLAVVFLLLLASGLFTVPRPGVEKPAAPRGGHGRPEA